MSDEKTTHYVAGFYFDRKFQKVVLIWKNKPEWQKGKLNGVGGKIKNGELPITAMRREFHEETGILHNEWVDLITLTGKGWQVHFFCTIAKPDQFEYAETKEEEEVAKIEVAQLHNFDHVPNLEWLVPMAIDKLAFPNEHMTMRGIAPALPAWVKCTERLPGITQTVNWRNEKGQELQGIRLRLMLMSIDANLDGWEWLDESAAAPATPNNDVERYELRLALYDMIKLVRRVLGNAIPPDQKRIEAAEGIIKKYFKVTDVLRSADEPAESEGNYYKLSDHLYEEHGLMLFETQLTDIIHLVNRYYPKEIDAEQIETIWINNSILIEGHEIDDIRYWSGKSIMEKDDFLKAIEQLKKQKGVSNEG